jgi:hypothetical protein
MLRQRVSWRQGLLRNQARLPSRLHQAMLRQKALI